MMVVCPSTIVKGEDELGDLSTQNNFAQIGGEILEFIGEMMKGKENTNSTIFCILSNNRTRLMKS